MKPYVGIVHKERGSAYGITFPDAPGCFAAADEMDGLFAAAEEALSLWLDGLAESGGTPPRTRDLEALRADAALSQAFADAALVIAVPAPGAGERRAA